MTAYPATPAPRKTFLTAATGRSPGAVGESRGSWCPIVVEARSDAGTGGARPLDGSQISRKVISFPLSTEGYEPILILLTRLRRVDSPAGAVGQMPAGQTRVAAEMILFEHSHQDRDRRAARQGKGQP